MRFAVINVFFAQKARLLNQTKESGNASFKSGNFKEALALYSEALLIDPANLVICCKLHSNRATVRAKLGSYAGAIEDCTRALEIDPDFSKVYWRRADCFMKLEKFEEAVRDYEKAFSMDGSNRGIIFVFQIYFHSLNIAVDVWQWILMSRLRRSTTRIGCG